MLAQVITSTAWWKTKTSEFVFVPFGTIVFVVSVDKIFGKIVVIHGELIYKIPISSLELVEDEKDILSWETIKNRERQKKQQIIDSINALGE